MSNPMIDLILAGAADEDIEAIYQAADQRRRIVAEKRALSLEAGEEFLLTNISPKYLNGCRCRFLKFRDDKIEAVLVEDTNRGHSRGAVLILLRTHVGQIIGRGL